MDEVCLLPLDRGRGEQQQACSDPGDQEEAEKYEPHRCDPAKQRPLLSGHWVSHKAEA
ncbi:hypothetical protein GCM10009672_21300 [Nesterenkonia lutea]